MTNLAFVPLFLSAFLTLATAHADQRPTMTCTGTDIVLTTKSPYLGEDSKFSQTLYVLKSKNSNDGESKDSAYFLNVSEEGATGRTIYTGSNEVGGYFQLDIGRPVNVGDGTTVQESADGYIDYSHGPLNGNREKVTCLRN